MERLKDLDFKILFELMRNSKRSDRELAREIGVSQPTVTRRRIKLEKNVIEGYTAIPNWKNIGFKIMAASRNCQTPEATRKAFQFAFDNIKPIDIVDVGMFQKHRNQAEENAAIVAELLR